MRFVKKAAIRLPYITFSGKNHAECIADLKKRSIQGFVIDDYSGSRFVDRKKALEVAKAAGQIVMKHNPKDQLLSEDMKWDEEHQRFLTGQELEK